MREQLELLPANELGREAFPWRRVVGRGARLDRELVNALSELRWGERAVCDERVESIARALHARAGLRRPFVDPRILAAAAGLQIIPVSGDDLRDGGRILGSTLYYRTTADRRRRCLRVAHELAHHALGRETHDHADVHALSAAILAPREGVLRCPTITALYRAHRGAPPCLLRYRFALLTARERPTDARELG
jgi:hypothetical protein